jgi:uncharacterized protein (TIGR03067 family)
MKQTLITLLSATFALVGTAADKSAAPQPDAYPRDGVWKPISAVLAGSKVPKPALNAISLRISGTNYEVSVMGERQPDRGRHALDESTTPKRITITSTNGPNKGKTFLGIYEVKDTNSFRVCYDLSGTAFPAKFESSSETGYYLAEYRRSDDKAPKSTNAVEDAKRQNGIWKPAGAILGGEKLKRDELNKITLTIKDGAYEVVVDGEPHADKGTISMDTSVTPKRMTIQGVEGPNKGKTILAIYEMGEIESGDTFRVCYDLSGKAFPIEFNSPTGSTHYLVGYRRQKGSAPVVPKGKKEAR